MEALVRNFCQLSSSQRKGISTAFRSKGFRRILAVVIQISQKLLQDKKQGSSFMKPTHTMQLQKHLQRITITLSTPFRGVLPAPLMPITSVPWLLKPTIQPAGMPEATVASPVCACSSNLSAVTKSTGRVIFTPFFSALAIRSLTIFDPSSSNKELPIWRNYLGKVRKRCLFSYWSLQQRRATVKPNCSDSNSGKTVFLKH